PDVDQGQDASNPVAMAFLRDSRQTIYRGWTSLKLEWNPIPSLVYRVQGGLDFSFTDQFTYQPEFEEVRRLFSPSSISVSKQQSINPLLEHYLTWEHTVSQHHWTMMGGFSAQAFRYSDLQASGESLPPGVVAIEAATTNLVTRALQIESALRSFFGRFSYSFRDKYFLTANLRRDESSKLYRTDHPVGWFPSVSSAWWISRETFMKSLPWISTMKLRAGWGKLGNQSPLSAYPTSTSLNTDFFYLFNNQVVQGVGQSELANANINWETTEQWNVGLETGFWKDQVQLGVEYYQRTTFDLLWRATVGPSVGMTPPFVNDGTVSSRGWEVEATFRTYSQRFQADFSANLTTINNELLSLQNGATEIFAGKASDDLTNVSITRIGQPIGSFYGYESAGIFQNWEEVYAWPRINQDPDRRQDAFTAATHTAPGDIKWVDQNKDGVVDEADRIILGNPIPDFIYGLTANLSYTDWDLQVLVQGVHGNEVFNVATHWLEDMRQNFNQGTAVLDRWTEDRPSTTIPRTTRSDPNQNILRVSDRYIEDGSFLRIRTLSLGYSFPKEVQTQLSTDRFRLYLTAQNLLTLTNYGGLEPEVGSLQSGTAVDAGIDRMIYPQPRTFLLGVQLAF
ncbi:MAG: SusC/RagA family TonB-linked outer membrane protein, partial [Bacteroidota bacterium]